jgi:hypothetical protein
MTNNNKKKNKEERGKALGVSSYLTLLVVP